jgi:hypothetical protein
VRVAYLGHYLFSQNERGWRAVVPVGYRLVAPCSLEMTPWFVRSCDQAGPRRGSLVIDNASVNNPNPEHNQLSS